MATNPTPPHHDQHHDDPTADSATNPHRHRLTPRNRQWPASAVQRPVRIPFRTADQRVVYSRSVSLAIRFSRAATQQQPTPHPAAEDHPHQRLLSSQSRAAAAVQ